MATRIRRSFDVVSWPAFAATLTRSRTRTQKVHVDYHLAGLKDALQRLEGELGHLCVGLEISAAFSGRLKTFASICRKIQLRQVGYQSIFDHVGVRVIVGSTAECYRLRDHIHRRYRCVSGHARDYVAKPKSNGYRSLHTTVLNADDIPVEIQLRTFEMDQQAVHGRAALRHYPREPAQYQAQSAVE